MTAITTSITVMTGHSPGESLVLIDPTSGSFDLADPSAPHLRVDDLAPHRGDGIFETVLVSVRDGRGHVHARERHFTRFRQSAAMLYLPSPEEPVWDAALETAIADHIARRPRIDAFTVRYALSRGTDRATGWAITIPLDGRFADQRRDGISVISLDRGYAAYFGQSNPWALVGAKTLSYAVNQAAGRWAGAHGADEALFFSHDGFALEGPTSNLLVRRGIELLTPDPKAGLLHGTTQQSVFARAADDGFLCSYTDLTEEDLLAADGAWLTSSGRRCVPIVSFDGTEIRHDRELTAKMDDWVLAS